MNNLVATVTANGRPSPDVDIKWTIENNGLIVLNLYAADSVAKTW